ncbi:hypothetical protein GFS24_18030 [Chitinophaga sp. SYP-B3965]|uniref:hypothetical protein n=1 Tax=Chitinophaga sp. SYP-B3965 TaxID=2663120 RepID=UPI001299E7BA|nr:hypothetical protein [Chitinophaga sp. SYP-B3965]MRG47027.1 hypothetical protein [Chitinophaga sp. SYP-B3965]
MKYNVYLLMLLLFAACKKSDTAYEKDFDKSYKTWTNFRTSSGDNYRYTVSTVSWTGTRTETSITVQAGKPVGRAFKRSNMDGGTGQITLMEEWQEDASNLNSHQNAFTPQTLDEIYQEAKAQWLPKRKDVTVYFEAKNSGMISSCGYVENGCQDDCFRGIRIVSIEKI